MDMKRFMGDFLAIPCLISQNNLPSAIHNKIRVMNYYTIKPLFGQCLNKITRILGDGKISNMVFSYSEMQVNFEI